MFASDPKRTWTCAVNLGQLHFEILVIWGREFIKTVEVIIMKIWYALTLAVAVGSGLGIIATRGLAAPTRAVYVVTELEEITDADRYEALQTMTMRGAIEAQFEDGRYLARTENVTALDGTAPKAIVIIAFDNEAKAKAYYNSSKEITATRKKATKSRSFLVERCTEQGKLVANC
jgi:uncharacterized protein (DUF1330 family)